MHCACCRMRPYLGPLSDLLASPVTPEAAPKQGRPRVLNYSESSSSNTIKISMPENSGDSASHDSTKSDITSQPCRNGHEDRGVLPCTASKKMSAPHEANKHILWAWQQPARREVVSSPQDHMQTPLQLPAISKFSMTSHANNKAPQLTAIHRETLDAPAAAGARPWALLQAPNTLESAFGNLSLLEGTASGPCMQQQQPYMVLPQQQSLFGNPTGPHPWAGTSQSSMMTRPSVQEPAYMQQAGDPRQWAYRGRQGPPALPPPVNPSRPETPALHQVPRGNSSSSIVVQGLFHQDARQTTWVCLLCLLVQAT